MSKERIRADISAFTKALVKITKLSTRQKRKIGQFAINMIRKRTRRGIGINTSKKTKRLVQKKLAKLQPSTIITRKKAKRLSKFARAGFSNLTFTGKMIQSLGVVRSSGNKITLGARGTRNENLLDWATKGNKGGSAPKRAPRPFLGLVVGEENKLAKFLESNFAKQLKKI